MDGVDSPVEEVIRPPPLPLSFVNFTKSSSSVLVQLSENDSISEESNSFSHFRIEASKASVEEEGGGGGYRADFREREK